VQLQLAVKALSPKSKCRMMAVRTKRTRRTRPKGSVRADKFLKQCKAKKTPETESMVLRRRKYFRAACLGSLGLRPLHCRVCRGGNYGPEADGEWEDQEHIYGDFCACPLQPNLIFDDGFL